MLSFHNIGCVLATDTKSSAIEPRSNGLDAKEETESNLCKQACTIALDFHYICDLSKTEKA